MCPKNSIIFFRDLAGIWQGTGNFRLKKSLKHFDNLTFNMFPSTHSFASSNPSTGFLGKDQQEKERKCI